jgi:hypothetical protein
MRKVVGLSLEKVAVCVLDRDGQLVWQGKIDSEPGALIEKLKLWQPRSSPNGRDDLVGSGRFASRARPRQGRIRVGNCFVAP